MRRTKTDGGLDTHRGFFFFWFSGDGAISQEFTSFERCQTAITEMQKDYGRSMSAICVRK